MHMRIVVRTIVSVCVLTLLGVCVVHAHPGGLDKYGGHWDHSTGTYHYHQTPAVTSVTAFIASSPAETEGGFHDILDSAKRCYAFNDYTRTIELLDKAKGIVLGYVRYLSVARIELESFDSVEIRHGGSRVYIQPGQQLKGHLILKRVGERVIWNHIIPTKAKTLLATFASSNAAVATVSDKGEFTALGPGTTTFTVVIGDKSVEIPLEVIDPGPVVGKTREELVKVLGWPEYVQAGRWTYERFPGLIIAFEEDEAVMVNEWDPLDKEYEEAMK